MEIYLYVKALHIISVISWMAGMLYLPRLFAYHVAMPAGSPQAETFKVMEKRLLRIIINPAMAATFLFGVWMLMLNPDLLQMGWLHAKFLLLSGMIAFHVFCSRWRRALECDRYVHSNKFFRMINEVPTLLMIGIVILAVAKPF